MKSKLLTLKDSAYPALLREIPDAPKQLYYLGSPPQELLEGTLSIGIVGSRKVSSYGRVVTQNLSRSLARQGLVIISGLAYGVDALAHQAALAEGAKVIAVLPCGLDEIYPSNHRQLARQILETGGSIISEYAEGTPPLKQHFIARNRIISGLSHGLLITEAAEKSGSLHTAGFALEQGRDVFAVPGNITSPSSVGTNNLIKTGAIPTTSPQDVLQVYEMSQYAEQVPLGANEYEARLIELVRQGITDSDELLSASGLAPELFSQTLTMMELSAKIKPTGNGQWSLQ